MTEAAKKISVVIRTYNSAKTVCRAIDSALGQTLSRDFYEIVAIDDESSDGTPALLEKKYGGKIRIIKQKHSGPAKTTNNAVKECAGEYITMLDSDDFLEPEALEKMKEAFDKDGSTDFAYCDYFEINNGKKKKISLKNNIFKALGCAIMFKKSLFSEVGFYDHDLIFSEYDFLIKLLKSKKKSGYIPVPLYNYRRSGGSLTADPEWVKRGFEQLKKKYGNIVEKIRSY